MIKKILFLFLLFISSFGFTNAVASIEIIGIVDEYTPYMEEITFNYECNDLIYFSFPKNALNVKYENGSKILNLQNFSISNCKNKTSLIYELNIAEEVLDYTRIERKFSTLDELNYSYSIKMPLHFKFNENESIPKNFTVQYFSDYKEISFSKNDVYLIYYIPLDPEKNSFSIAKLQEEMFEPIVILLLIIFFTLGFFSAFYIYKKNTSKILSNHVPSYILSKEEKMIIGVIEKNPGINQKLIGKELDFSKARVSAFVTDLEQKGLIRRERFGRTSKVFMNKKII